MPAFHNIHQKEKAYHSLKKLLMWVDSNDWTGYDPYDIKAHPWVIRFTRKSQHSNIYTLLREFVFELFYMFPVLSRKILKIKPAINPKAMGLFANAYLDIYQLTNDEQFLFKAESCLDWLIQHPSDTSVGLGWGYPFDWQSTEFIPKETPNGIVTTTIGEAFRKIYKLSRDEKYLNILTRIGSFLASLPKDYLNNQQLCFAYTPIFQNHVHNLNLFIAEYLLDIGTETNNEQWLTLANKAINYTLQDQHSDGSFDYNGPPEKPARFIDHYHTGFVLRTLLSIREITNREDVYKALEKGYHFYITHFFEKDVIPKLKPDRIYRIDIHSCAEAINCLCSLGKVFPGAAKKAEGVMEWTLKNMQDRDGHFYYGILKSRFTGIIFKSKIPYLRWGQAWIMKAFAAYLKTKTVN